VSIIQRTIPGGVVVMLVTIAASGMLAGCSQHPMERGFSDLKRTQIQFFAPPGATVTVKDCPTRSHQVAAYGPFDNRLEQTPEEFCVFNLRPGRYEFKYVSAEGLPGVSIYGELDVKEANTETAARFHELAFIPIALPSEYYKKTEINGNEIYPYRGESYRIAIDENDVIRLKQGDMVEKVFFVADLEKAEKLRDKLISDLKVKEREIEYAEARFREAYRDFRIDVSDSTANFLGTDKEYIRWEKERQEQAMKYDAMQKKLKRTQALLKGDTVLIRKGMLALATEEIVKPYRDVEDASEKLGEVVLVMRLGGRHMQWDDPNHKLVSSIKD
jgi:hypothetical protein